MSANSPQTGVFATVSHWKIGKMLYLSKDYSDFIFIFESSDGKREEVPVHKSVLASVSTVFRAMFNGAWKEEREGTINASASAFKEFMQIFYLDKAKLTMDNVMEVIELGKMYDVTECFDICAEFLKRNLKANNVCWVYEWAVRLEHKELEEKCDTRYERSTKAVLESDYFLQCDRSTVQHILQMDPINCSEVDCLKALMKWIKMKSGQEELTKEIVQDQFADLLHEIRFGSMTLTEFGALDPLYGEIFTNAQHSEIYQMMNSTEYQSKVFKANRRKWYGWDKDAEIFIDRETNFNAKPYFIKSLESPKFTVNKSGLLGAFHCLGIISTDWEDIQIEFKVTKTQYPNSSADKEVLYTGYCTLTSASQSRINLSKPISIHPGFMYEIELKFKYEIELQLQSEIGFNLEDMESSECTVDDVTIWFHDDPVIDNRKRGLIFALYLNKV